MNKEVVKKGYELAQEELEDKQIQVVKEIVKRSLEKKKELEKQVDELQEEIRILKLDIEDLKEGHLDRIEERQNKDKKAKKVSVVEIIKEIHHHHYDRWYQPYVIKFVEPPPVVFPLPNTWFANGCPVGIANDCSITSNSANAFTLNNSVAKCNAAGAYSIGNDTVHLR